MTTHLRLYRKVRRGLVLSFSMIDSFRVYGCMLTPSAGYWREQVSTWATSGIVAAGYAGYQMEIFE